MCWWVVNATPQRFYNWERDPVAILQEAVWTLGTEKSSPQRDSNPGAYSPYGVPLLTTLSRPQLVWGFVWPLKRNVLFWLSVDSRRLNGVRNIVLFSLIEYPYLQWSSDCSVTEKFLSRNFVIPDEYFPSLARRTVVVEVFCICQACSAVHNAVGLQSFVV